MNINKDNCNPGCGQEGARGKDLSQISADQDQRKPARTQICDDQREIASVMIPASANKAT